MVQNYNKDYNIFVVDTDAGVGVLQVASSNVPIIEYDDFYLWENMINNPIKEINLISQQDFLDRLIYN